ncbi:AAA family ATPase [Caminicella sporogenes]|uniref:AAA family ATPase n=1 Tax=Caminicella sporogenes TaxID=166485 RepID=UPI002540EAC8|nr:AAA family ATPase [Caminicella sporogenes]WIF94884.1 AAA family ATPase [Caminicella sporogenes]
MSQILVNVFNTPYAVIDSKKVNFPFMKAEALFYYLIVKKQATRDELVFLFWSDSDEKTAKKNLRNAMYKIRKAFEKDIIISPKKSIVMLNPEINIKSDYEEFLRGNVNFYSGEFLQGFYVKNAPNFDEWLFEMREYLKNIFISKLNQNLEVALSKKDFVKAEKYAKFLIKEDEYDERTYRILMDIYIKQGLYNKAIDLYQRLRKTLKIDLDIEPDIKTKKLYNSVLLLKNAKDTENNLDEKDFFYGRKRELKELKSNFFNFINGRDYNSILIKGEAGIGKTKLKDKFIEYIGTSCDNIYILHANCYQVEKNYFLKPWNEIFLKLSNIIERDNINIPNSWKKIISYIFPEFNKKVSDDENPIEQLDTLKFNVIEEAIQGLIRKISELKKIILVFEDLQWMDNLSLTLLSAIILRNSNIMLIGTCREGCDKDVEKCITVLNNYNKIKVLKIKRFNEAEVEDFINKYIPEIELTKEIKEKIYRETEGNTFFLVEFLNMIKQNGTLSTTLSSKMKDIMRSKFLDISDEGKKILYIACIFFDKVDLDIIKSLLNKDEIEIIDIIEELQNKYILKEVNDEKISYKFTHQKIREFIYNNLSKAKKRMLHKKVARLLESSLKQDKRDVIIYPNIIYHYLNSQDYLSALKYTIKYLDVYFDFEHELFPILEDKKVIYDDSLSINKEQILKYFKSTEELLKKVKKNNIIDRQIEMLEISYLHIKGRYLIREGEYDSGIRYIDNMIDMALKIKSYTYSLKGYRQKIYYCIQVHETNMMREYIDKALEIAYKEKFKEDIAILLRLKGLNKIMLERYSEAEEILIKSINIFKSINDSKGKYSLNIAACYNYIGEIRRHNMKFSEALTFYNKAMQLCEEKNIVRGLYIFNTNAGQAAFEMGDYILAKDYLERALDFYKELGSIWGRAIAEGYMALLQSKAGNYKSSLRHLKNADYYAQKLKSPYEIGIIYRVKAEIKKNMQTNKELNDEFKDYLTLTIEQYCKKGINFLKEVKESYEIEILKALKK